MAQIYTVQLGFGNYPTGQFVVFASETEGHEIVVTDATITVGGPTPAAAHIFIRDPGRGDAYLMLEKDVSGTKHWQGRAALQLGQAVWGYSDQPGWTIIITGYDFVVS